MTGPLTILTITLVATIMLTGALSIAPNAFSTGYSNDHDDCDDDHSSYGDDHHNDGHHSDDDDDCVPDPCDCKKPTKFTVRYAGPGDSDNPAIVEIYKKTEKIGDKDPLVPGKDVYEPNLLSIPPDDPDSNQIMVSASDFGKKKLGSNTGYRILWDIPGDLDVDGNQIRTEIARIDIHTSCSKLLYIGQEFSVVIPVEITDKFPPGEDRTTVTLTVEDGTRKGKTSIPISDPAICEAPPLPTPTATIILKKALTNDNGADLTNVVFTPRIDGVPYEFDMPISVDAGVPHMISEDPVDGFTPVLLTGDTKCPAMLNENFILKAGQEITCTIYNDDDFIPGGGTGEPGTGVVFRPTSVMFTPGEVNSFTIPASEGGGVVTIDSTSFDSIIVIDPEFQKPTAPNLIVIYTIIDQGTTSQPIQCLSEGLFAVDMTTTGFLLTCPNFLNANPHTLNFALIKTLVLPPV